MPKCMVVVEVCRKRQMSIAIKPLNAFDSSFRALLLGGSLIPKLDHDVRNFDIFFSRILHCHLEDHVLLMIRDRLLADRLYQLAQPVHRLLAFDSVLTTQSVAIRTYLRPRRSLSLLGG